MKVSVCIVTYNQKKYIRECLDSIITQDTNFLFEIIIGDDASTDGTREIIEEYALKYPNLIKPIFHEKNIGPTHNYFQVHNAAVGEYVAHLDGDDYALPGKLKALVSHLEAYPDCGIVWHRMLVINEKGQSAVAMPIVPISRVIKSKKLYAIDLAKYYGLTGCHSGSMYRRCVKKHSSSIEEQIDFFITLSFTEDYYCAMYIEDVYGVYRSFSNEITLTKTEHNGAALIGEAKLRLIKYYLKTNPKLAKSFSTLCLYELFIRHYFRYPLRWDFLKMFFSCRSIPSMSDIILVSKVFMNNRHKKLQQEFNKQTIT